MRASLKIQNPYASMRVNRSLSKVDVHDPYFTPTGVKPVREVILDDSIKDSINFTALVEREVAQIVNGMDIDPVKSKTDINLPVYWDEIRKINYVLLSYNPRGDLISLVCKTPAGEVSEDLLVDGKFNIAGNRVDFLEDYSVTGYTVEAKYII